MTFRRVAAHLLPALAYGGFIHSLVFGLLLTRYHGYYDPSAPGQHVYYLDIHRHRWPAFPVLAAIFILFIGIPAVTAVIVAWRRPFTLLETAPALVTHSISLFFALAFNGLFCILAALAGWNEESF